MKIKKFFGGFLSFLFFMIVLGLMILLSSYNPKGFWIFLGAMVLITVGLMILLKRMSAKREAQEAAEAEAAGEIKAEAGEETPGEVIVPAVDPMAEFYAPAADESSVEEEAEEDAEEAEEEDYDAELPLEAGEFRWEAGTRKVGSDVGPGTYDLRVLLGEGYLLVAAAKGGIRVATPMGRGDYERADACPGLALAKGETVTTDGTLVLGVRIR